MPCVGSMPCRSAQLMISAVLTASRRACPGLSIISTGFDESAIGMRASCLSWIWRGNQLSIGRNTRLSIWNTNGSGSCSSRRRLTVVRARAPAQVNRNRENACGR